MNKILTTLLLAIAMALVGCAQLGEKAIDPMKIVVAQATSPGGPSQAEVTALKLKVERMEKLLDSLNYAKANHSHPGKNKTDRDHTHSQYLEREGLFGGGSYAESDHTHSQYLEGGLFGGGSYAESGHTHDYASSYHSHGNRW